MASIDLLTGILNKRTFEEYSGNILENSLESESHALIILDLDDFKRVNDTNGHAYGDKVLEKTGEILRSVFSDDDYIGRIGGDEFGVLVNARIEDIAEFERLLKDKCEELMQAYHSSYSETGTGKKVSASIGVALSPQHGKTFEELYSACDKALYRSKNSGRDTYTFFDAQNESDGERHE